MKNKWLKKSMIACMATLLCAELLLSDVAFAIETISMNGMKSEVIKQEEISESASDLNMESEISLDQEIYPESISENAFDLETVSENEVGMENAPAVPSNPTTITYASTNPSGNTGYFLEFGSNTDWIWFKYTAEAGVNGIHVMGNYSQRFTVYDASMNCMLEDNYLNSEPGTGIKYCCSYGEFYVPFQTSNVYYIGYKKYNTNTLNFKLLKVAIPTSIQLSMERTTLKIGEKLSVSKSFTPADITLVYPFVFNTVSTSNFNIYFSTSYKSIIDDVDGRGLGTATFKSYMKNNSTVNDTLTINVVAPEEGEIQTIEREQVKKVTLTEDCYCSYFKFTAPIDDTYRFFSTGRIDSYGLIYDINWKELDYDDDDGDGANFFITRTLKAGESVYLVARKFAASSTGSFDVSVEGEKVYVVAGKEEDILNPVDTGIHVSTIDLDFTKLKVAKGRRFTIHADVFPENYTDELTWTSSNPKYVSVTRGGVIRGKKAGKSAIITVSAPNGVSATCVVTVPKKEVKSTSVSVKKKSIKLNVGQSRQIKASMKPKNTTDNKTYSSKNEKVCKVSSKGVITAVEKGKTTVRVKTTSGKYAYVKVVVK